MPEMRRTRRRVDGRIKPGHDKIIYIQ